MRNKGRVFVMSVIIALLLVIGTDTFSFAVGGSSALTKITLAVRDIGGSDSKVLSIAARLFDADRPLGSQTLDFFVTTDFFGNRPVNIGQAVTDATGTASVAYQPRWEGAHVITVRFQGNAKYASAETSLTTEVTGPVWTYTSEKAGLYSVGGWVLLTAGLLFLVVWGILLVIIIRLVRGISHYGPAKRTVALREGPAFIPTENTEEANLRKGVTYASAKARGNRS